MTTFFSAQYTSRRRRLTTFLMLALLAVGFTSQASLASAESTLVGPFDNGCYYFWDGAQYVEGQCPQADGSFDVYTPANGGWAYSFNRWVDENGVEHRTALDGGIAELYPDGSIYLQTAEGIYAVIGTGGETLMELGQIDASGAKVVTGYLDATGTWINVGTTSTAMGSGTPLSEADIAQIHEQYNNMQNGITDNPPPACVHILPTADYNNDGITENSDLYDKCAR